MYPETGSDCVFPLSQGSPERLPIRPPRLPLFAPSTPVAAGGPAEGNLADRPPRRIGFAAENFSGATARNPQ